jgi:hypothetical protein
MSSLVLPNFRVTELNTCKQPVRGVSFRWNSSISASWFTVFTSIKLADFSVSLPIVSNFLNKFKRALDLHFISTVAEKSLTIRHTKFKNWHCFCKIHCKCHQHFVTVYRRPYCIPLHADIRK